MPITFGSVGDLIAAVQVAYKLIEVLSAQNGAPREYRDVITYLQQYRRLLNGLLAYWQTRRSSVELDALCAILLPVIRESHEEIESFLERISTKYGDALASPSKRNPNCVAKMLQWHLLERDKIARLQQILPRNIDLILLVQNQASLIAQEQDQVLINEKFSALEVAEAEAAADLNETLKRLETKADSQIEAFRSISNSIENVTAVIHPVPSLMSGLATKLADVYGELMVQRTLYSTINPYSHNSAIIEDALGYAIQIPLDILGSWNTLHSILLDKFENRPGRSLVLQRRYVLRDDLNGTELCQKKPLSLFTRPGQKINMFITCLGYFSEKQHLMACPRCTQSTLLANGTSFSCLNSKCGMEIERVADAEADVALIKDKHNGRDDFAHSEEKYAEMLDGEDVLLEFNQSKPSGPFCPPEIEDGPELFKRVRFLTRWEFRAESRGVKVYRTRQYFWWTCRCPEADAMIHAIATAVSRSLLSPNMGYKNYDDYTWKEFICGTMFFVGPSLQQTRPVFWIFSMNKIVRDRWRSICEGIPWIRNNPLLFVVTTCHQVFHESVKALWKYDHENRYTAKQLVDMGGEIPVRAYKDAPLF